MVTLAGAEAGFAIFSGLALAALGSLLLATRPRRTYATAFGLFLVLWAAQIVLGNLARLSALDGDAAAAERWVLLSLPPFLCLYVPLAYFAATYPVRRGVVATRPGAAALLLVPAAVGAMALAAAPGLFYGGLVGSLAETRSVWGPAHTLFGALFIGTFYHALLSLHRCQAAARDPAEARRALFAEGALFLYAAYWAGETLATSGAALLAGSPGGAPWQGLVLAAAAASGLVLAGAAALGLRREARPGLARPARAAALAAVVPALFGLASGASGAAGWAPLETLGVWRTLSAAALFYAIVRFELFDVDVKPLLAELTRTRTELQVEKRLAQRLVESSVDGIFAFDREGRVTLWNPGMERLSGLAKAEALGRPVPEVLPPMRGDHELLRAALEGKSLATEPRRRRLGRRGGLAVLESHFSPIHGEAGRVVGGLAIVHDVTERAHAEEARRLGEELERLRELDLLKTRFINTVAHELNTPLTAMKLNVDLLAAERASLAPRQRRAVEVLHRNMERMGSVLRDMLDAARLQSGRLPLRPGETDMGQVVRDAAETLAEAARHAGVRVSLRAPRGVRVEADGPRVAQVVLNLLGNAIKFTPRGGAVTLEARLQGGEAVVLVHDMGAGLATEDIPQLFQPFVQLHDTMQHTRAGTGLGLFISKGIVELHGGRIWADSEGPGKGATFGFALPRRPAPPRDEPAAVPAA